MPWQYQYFPFLFAGTTIINGSGVFIYGPGAPATGNLIFSVAGNGGVDSFGNSYTADVNVGKSIIFNTSGSFWYNGTHGSGKQIAAIAGSATTDPFGDAIPEGVTSWVYPTGGDVYYVNLNDATLPSIVGTPGAYFTFNDLTNPYNQAAYIGVAGTGGVSGTGPEMSLSSGKAQASDVAAMFQLISKQASGTVSGAYATHSTAINTQASIPANSKNQPGLWMGSVDVSNFFPIWADGSGNGQLWDGGNYQVIDSNVHSVSGGTVGSPKSYGRLSSIIIGNGMPTLIQNVAYTFEIYVVIGPTAGAPFNAHIVVSWLQGGATPTYWQASSVAVPSAGGANGVAGNVIGHDLANPQAVADYFVPMVSGQLVIIRIIGSIRCANAGGGTFGIQGYTPLATGQSYQVQAGSNARFAVAYSGGFQ